MSSNLALSFVAGAAVAAGAFTFAPPRAQEGDVPAEMAKAFAEAAKWTAPGPMHAKLEAYLGKWDAEYRIFAMAGQPPMTSRAKVEISWLMEGRWLEQRYDGELMGGPFQGFGLLGYDNFKQAFVSCWVDNKSTYMTTSLGKLAQDGRTLISYGTLDEYLTGEHDKTVKYVHRWKSRDQFTMEIHDLAIGEENTKVVEIAYTRAR
jgi:hypothetical protein